MDPRNMQAEPAESFRRPYQPGCMGCMSRVPCCSMVSWIVLLIGCGMYVGGTFIGLKFIRELFQNPSMFPFFEWGAIAFAGLTLFLSTNFLLINSCSSGVTSRHLLITKARNAGAGCCISMSLFLAYLMQLLWTIALCVHCIPVAILLVTTWFRDPTHKGCIDFRNYGLRASSDSLDTAVMVGSNEDVAKAGTVNATVFYKVLSSPSESVHFCGQELEYYDNNKMHLLVPLAIALGGAFFTILGMLNFVICLAGNFKHVKELRHLPYTRGCDEYAEVECEFNGGHNGVHHANRKHHDPAQDKMLHGPR